MSARRVVAVFAVALGVAALAGVLVARHDEAQAFAERLVTSATLARHVPPYPDSRAMPLGETVHVSGVARELAYALTVDAPDKVADRYEGIWRSQGLRVERRAHDGAEWVTAFADEDPWVRTVVASATERGTVLVQSLRPLRGSAAVPAFPCPAGCVLLDHTGARDGGVTTEVVFLACDGYLAELVDFYDDLLVSLERRERLRESGPASLFVTYSGATHEVSLAATESGDPPRVAATITWQERR